MTANQAAPPDAAGGNPGDDAPIRYPLSTHPVTGDGSAVEIAEGVHWLRMPVGDSLPWINVWVLADDEGWTIVDTGMRTNATVSAWRKSFAGVMCGRPVARVIATHMHPDHCGLAGWLTERFGVRLWMTELEYLTSRVLSSDSGRTAPDEALGFYRGAGWSVEEIGTYQSRFGEFGQYIYPLPPTFRRMRDGMKIRIGVHEWTVIVGNGHSPEHACLYCPSLGLLISGDQVLPAISSNVSVHPMEPDADPLDDWLASLARIEERVPDNVLVLPAHNHPFRGLHARLAQLRQGHERALERLLEALREQPSSVIEAFPAVFGRRIGGGALGMATGEGLAHLNYLSARGQIIRETDANGVWKWRRSLAPGQED